VWRVIVTSSEKAVELWSQGLSVDHDWVVAFDVEDADLKQRPVRCWADEHCQVVVQEYSSHRIANCMPYVRVGDPVLSRWFADPHLDNIACLADDIVDRARQTPVGYAKLSGSARTMGFAQRMVLSTFRTIDMRRGALSA
jgi:hypothetical protein